jgi:hypothetical protein
MELTSGKNDPEQSKKKNSHLLKQLSGAVAHELDKRSQIDGKSPASSKLTLFVTGNLAITYGNDGHFLNF